MNASQYAFCTITGFEPNLPFFSACVGDWRDMGGYEIDENAYATLDYLPEDVDGTTFDLTAVREAVISVQSAQGTNDWHKAYQSLSVA